LVIKIYYFHTPYDINILQIEQMYENGLAEAFAMVGDSNIKSNTKETAEIWNPYVWS
jgi:hypothetical protein